MKRRAFAVAAASCLAVALLVALWPGGGRAEGALRLEKVRLILQWKPQAQFAGYYMAAAKGFYEDHGLDVRVLPGGPSIDPIAALTSGKADFATSFLTGAIAAASAGAPLVDVCQVVNRSSLMLVARRREVKDRRDLDGKRVSLWGSSFRSAYLDYFRAARVKPTIVPQYYSVNLFLRGGVDACAAMEYNEYHSLMQAGVDPGRLTTFFLRDAGCGFPEDGIYTLARTAQRRPDLCRQLAAATMEGWAYCRQHPAAAVDIVMRRARAAHVPTNRVHQRWMLDHILAAIYPGKQGTWRAGKLSRADYQRARAVMIDGGQIEHAPSFERFVAPGARGAP